MYSRWHAISRFLVTAGKHIPVEMNTHATTEGQCFLLVPPCGYITRTPGQLKIIKERWQRVSWVLAVAAVTTEPDSGKLKNLLLEASNSKGGGWASVVKKAKVSNINKQAYYFLLFLSLGSPDRNHNTLGFTQSTPFGLPSFRSVIHSVGSRNTAQSFLSNFL